MITAADIEHAGSPFHPHHTTMAHDAFHAQEDPAPPPRPRRSSRQQRRSPPTAAEPGAGYRSGIRGHEYFQCPELDHRMRKYLVKLANDTANHLIRDTLESEPTNIVWKPMTTIKGIDILRGYEREPIEPAQKTTCLRGVAEVNASIEEFAMLFKLDSNKDLAEHGLLFNPDLLDTTTLYALVPPSGDHPRRYVGIKWCLVQSPSRLFRNRDFCYLECQKEFRDASGRRGWVRSLHSIKMPCCPSLEKTHHIVRASLYRCGLVAVETDQPGVLATTYTIEMDLKGHFPELFQPAFLSQRIAALASIDKFLQQQRLSSSPLLGDLDIPTNRVKGTCHYCFRAFSTFTRRHICRRCGEGVCRHCSDDWMLDIPVIGRKKIRICTVCSAEARFCHLQQRLTMTPTAGRGVGRSSSLPHGELAAMISPGPMRRQSISESFTTGPDLHTYRTMAPASDRTFAPQTNDTYRGSEFAELDELGTSNDAGIRGTADFTGMWAAALKNAPHRQPTVSAARRSIQAYGRRLNSRQTTEPTPSWIREQQAPPPPQRRASRASHGLQATMYSVQAPPTSRTMDARLSFSSPSEYLLSPGEYFGVRPSNGTRDQQQHFPPSSRYSVVGGRLQRSNSFDAARHFHRQQQHLQHQQSQKPPAPRQKSPRREPVHESNIAADGRNVALDFVNHMHRRPSQPEPRRSTPHPSAFTALSKTPQPESLPSPPRNQPDPPPSPNQTAGEVYEYVESENGEWVESFSLPFGDRVFSLSDLQDTEPLETQLCEKCGAKQYVHEGVIEATCTCEFENEEIPERLSVDVEVPSAGQSSSPDVDRSWLGSSGQSTMCESKALVTSVDFDDELVQQLSQHSLLAGNDKEEPVELRACQHVAMVSM